MEPIANVVTTGTIFCKDGTVRAVKGLLKNYSEFGKIVEGDNYRSSTIDAAQHIKEDKPVKARRSEEEVKALKAEKKAFKQRLMLLYPEMALSMTANQIWNKVCTRATSD